MANAKTKKPTAMKGGFLSITAPHKYRRANLAFGPVAVIINIDDLSDEQTEILAADKIISVKPCADPDDIPADPEE